MLTNSAYIYTTSFFGGVEVLIADFTNHQFDAHWHDTWSIGTVVSGAHDNSPRATGNGIVNSGQVTVIAPGEVHAGRVLSPNRCKYVMFYIQDAELRKAFEHLDQRVPSVSNLTFESPELHQELAHCAMQLADPSTTLFDTEVSWARCLALIVEQLSLTVVINSLPPRIEDFKKVAIARDYLDNHYYEMITLDQLAQEANLSKFHLCREFSRIFNISPNKYLRQLRLIKAKQLLSDGYPVAEIATTCGFSDQSHLGRHFKAVFGVSPKKYADEFK
ncbi:MULTISPECIES: AraC family transcriptional regulator [unclassified Vibrio]|uniref:AraC family transcriptional regulator n=1 Tax=unclassified Vibrio TaxID=2614977 RepID=UPI001268B56B|nr:MULTISPECIES: AraC family transcriptional regulator [unclassified Vibrio]QFT39786.1 HTH-type transcriptional activator RhaS [Vibrio sp. THAF64]QGM37707.1 HTH-type transcriptional activator RhaS [Vibrio sp. THAF191d]QGN73050.1 HTH-type transcriptional activator RhaS [Vibrio sp. THAF191c]